MKSEDLSFEQVGHSPGGQLPLQATSCCWGWMQGNSDLRAVLAVRGSAPSHPSSPPNPPPMSVQMVRYIKLDNRSSIRERNDQTAK